MSIKETKEDNKFESCIYYFYYYFYRMDEKYFNKQLRVITIHSN